jgi:DNA-binding NtrC family response regulator
MVVICDDEQRLASLTVGLLESLGHEARAVGGLDQLRALIAAGESFDVLLLDANLREPQEVGEVLRLMSNERPTARVVLTSGYSREDLPSALTQAAQVRGFLSKPFTLDELQRAVNA